jgi:hypothetical protein
MYVRTAASSMGCSVSELIGLSTPTVDELERSKSDGVTLCVTNSGQTQAEAELKKAGYILVAEYKNYNAGHTGNKCKLWAAFKDKSEAKILPDGGLEAIKEAAEQRLREEAAKEALWLKRFEKAIKKVSKAFIK